MFGRKFRRMSMNVEYAADFTESEFVASVQKPYRTLAGAGRENLYVISLVSRDTSGVEYGVALSVLEDECENVADILHDQGIRGDTPRVTVPP